MAEYANDRVLEADNNGAATVVRLVLRSHTHGMSVSEYTDMRDEAVTSAAALDTWWSNQGGAKASWWSGLSSADKACFRTEILAYAP